MVRRKCLQETSLPHDHKTCTIDQTPLLVWSLSEQLLPLCIEHWVHMHNVDGRRRFQSLNEGNDFWVGNPEWADQECHKFSENRVRSKELVPLLPDTAIDSRGMVVVCLRGINKVAPASGTRKDVRYLDGLQGLHGAWSPLLTVR